MLIKQGKTNIKYLFIVTILAIFSGAIMIGELEMMKCPYWWPSTQQTSTVDETADWKTYINEEYGFEMKYPKDWNYGPNILTEAPGMVFCPPELSDTNPEVGCKVEPNISPMPDSLAPIFLFVSNKPGGTFSLDDLAMKQCEKSELKTINDILMKVSYCGERGQEAIWYSPGNAYVFRLLLVDNSFSVTFNQMLSTFSFVEEEIISWETYKNEEYGFEVKYPADWSIKLKDPLERCQVEGFKCDCLVYLQFFPPSVLNYSWINLLVYSNPNKYSIEEEWLSENIPFYNSQAVSIDNKFEIGGKEGLKIISVNGCKATQSYISKEEYFFELTTCAGPGQEKTNDIYDQMLSTFRFLEEEEPYIEVISPNGREEWVVGETYDIKWDVSSYNFNKPVMISLWDVTFDPDDEIGPFNIATNVISDGVYSWTIPSILQEVTLGGDKYKIIIYLEGMRKEDQSDNYFSIFSYQTYRNEEYGFEIALPGSWEGYSILMKNWNGFKIDNPSVKFQGPKIVIRNPKWTTEQPWQDIPIMVFTEYEWSLIEENNLNVSAAPIGPSKLGENENYIFALPPRWIGFTDALGQQEARDIVETFIAI